MHSRIDPRGSSFLWPERDDEEKAELARLLTSAQEGAATIAECLQAAERIPRGNRESWCREWRRLAEAAARGGELAFAAGSPATAARSWLRAINYYLASIRLFERPDRRCRAAIAAMRECAAHYLRRTHVNGEIVSIPWRKDRGLQAYLLRPGASRNPSPLVICLGEPGHRKEEYLFKLAGHARERGLNMLALDLWGESNSDCLAEVISGLEEEVLPVVIDHLSARSDVDVSRIAVLADDWGSSFVAREIAAEPRICAAACDGGLWDLHERSFLAGRSSGGGSDPASNPFASPVMRNIACPLLITLGERGWLEVGRVGKIVDQLRSSGRDVTLKVFKSAETASEQGHADNPTFANEFIFDWLSARLGQTLSVARVLRAVR